MYLCKECYLELYPENKQQAMYWCKGKSYPIDETIFEHKIRMGQLPKWEYAQSGRKPCCEKCGKEGTVYG